MVTILIMMKRVLISVGALLLAVFLIGGFFIYRFREMILGKMPLMPDELKVAKVVSGASRFSKEILYSQPDLGVITDIVGFNGDGGVRLLSPEGKELWKQDDGNVWHVEIAAADASSGNVILHSNARGQLTIRDSTGNVLGRYSPEIYLSHFALTAWGDDPSHNKLVAADKSFIYVLTMEGKTVAHLPAPASTSMAQPKGTPVRLAGGAPYFASLLRNFLWNRSLLYIYDGQNQLVYQEILDHDCDALHAIPGEHGAENLLLGCDGTVWKYSQAANR